MRLWCAEMARLPTWDKQRIESRRMRRPLMPRVVGSALVSSTFMFTAGVAVISWTAILKLSSKAAGRTPDTGLLRYFLPPARAALSKFEQCWMPATSLNRRGPRRTALPLAGYTCTVLTSQKTKWGVMPNLDAARPLQKNTKPTSNRESSRLRRAQLNYRARQIFTATRVAKAAWSPAATQIPAGPRWKPLLRMACDM